MKYESRRMTYDEGFAFQLRILQTRQEDTATTLAYLKERLFVCEQKQKRIKRKIQAGYWHSGTCTDQAQTSVYNGQVIVEYLQRQVQEYVGYVAHTERDILELCHQHAISFIQEDTATDKD